MAVHLVRNDAGELEIRTCKCAPKPRPEKLSALDFVATMNDIRSLNNPKKESTTTLGFLWEIAVDGLRIWRAKKYLDRYGK